MGQISSEEFVYMTPGVQVGATGDGLGQQYQTPDHVIREKRSDIIIVGRGIYRADDPKKAAQAYREAGWVAYQERISADANLG